MTQTPDNSSLAGSYRERLWPNLTITLVILGAAASLWVLLLPFSPDAAIWISLGFAVAALVAAGFVSPVVEVRDGVLRAGKAQIPTSALGAAQEISQDERPAQLRAELDLKAYVLLRAWVKTMVKVPVVDQSDPTPYWLISTRHPDKLLAALNEAAE